MRLQHPGITPCLIQNQVREKWFLFPEGVSRPPGEEFCKSLQTEHERRVGTKPHSLGGPTAAKITDKLTYKEFLFCEQTPKVSSRAAGRRDTPQNGSFSSSPAQCPGTPASQSANERKDFTAIKGRVPEHGQGAILSLRSRPLLLSGAACTPTL